MADVSKKVRRHHNRSGLRQVKRGKTREQVREMARRLGIPYGAATRNATPEAVLLTEENESLSSD